MSLSRFFPTVFALCLLVSLPTAAQPQEGAAVGFGVSINSLSIAAGVGDDGGTASLTPVNFSVPITTRSFRIEPEIGFARTSQSTEESSRTRSVFNVGTRLFLISRYDDAQFLFGGRIGISHRSSSTEIDFEDRDESTSATDFSIGPAVGGEYYFNNHFSIGVEARFTYVNVGSPDNAPDDFSASRLRTSGVATLRFHF